MSAYEVLSTFGQIAALEETHKPAVSDEEWANAEEMLAAVTWNDPTVRLH